MNDPSEHLSDDEADRSRVVERWLALDGGWRATVLGLVIVVATFAVGVH